MKVVSTSRKDPEFLLFGRYSAASFRRISEWLPCGIQEEYLRKLSGLSDEGARKDLNELVEKNILDLRGKGRNTHYILKRVGD
ncbi:MAG: hypothetical protein LWX51_13010 [Deltaproteobacteria bacterium]|nr:hypothetical protein [Deltaproteobacteria bacterium]